MGTTKVRVGDEVELTGESWASEYHNLQGQRVRIEGDDDRAFPYPYFTHPEQGRLYIYGREDFPEEDYSVTIIKEEN